MTTRVWIACWWTSLYHLLVWIRQQRLHPNRYSVNEPWLGSFFTATADLASHLSSNWVFMAEQACAGTCEYWWNTDVERCVNRTTNSGRQTFRPFETLIGCNASSRVWDFVSFCAPTGIAHPVECEKHYSHHARQKNSWQLSLWNWSEFLSLKW